MFSLKKRRNRGVVVLVLFLTFFALSAESCGETKPSSTESESQSRDGSYDALVKGQPAHSMNYSPTRDTINGWIDTWGKKGAVSYVYLKAADGSLQGYFVLKGLPVSYCQGLTPPYRKADIDLGTEGGETIVPAPGVDGVFYGGADCNRYYGFTADTGAYVEYTVGQGISVLLYNQPLPEANNVPNLAPDK